MNHCMNIFFYSHAHKRKKKLDELDGEEAGRREKKRTSVCDVCSWDFERCFEMRKAKDLRWHVQ